MTTSLRIMALLLGLFGLERIIYADIVAVLPRLPGPTPMLNTMMGLSILIVAVGLYVGFGWSRWPGIIGAALIGLQGIMPTPYSRQAGTTSISTSRTARL